ncbi:hypothetical protein [Alkalibacter mobilis]|nr:hypothetical protein [Alkalibacter mobilis]
MVNDKTVQELFEELKLNLTFLPNEEAKEELLKIFTYVLSM